MSRTTWAPARADAFAAPGHGDAFGDRFPTQPLAVGHGRAGLGLDDPRTPSRHPHHAAPGGASRAPARSSRAAVLIAVAAVIAALTGVLGYRAVASSFPSALPDAPARPAPATGPAAADRRADDVPLPPPPPGDVPDRDRAGAAGRADGAVPEGVTVFDDGFPAVANLDPDLLDALRRAATDAADDGVAFHVNSGWRSAEYQAELLRKAVAEYGSEEEAARWVATPDTSAHVSGDAVDIGPADAAAWLSDHGAEYGLCQIYRNEPWHFELRPEAADRGCPPTYADPTHDPRTQK